MAREASIIDGQSMEIVVAGPGDANRMFVSSGKLVINFSAHDNTAHGSGVVQKETFTALIDPQFADGQFRRAIATASLSSINSFDNDPEHCDGVEWAIEEAQADFDDESGKVRLRVGVRLRPSGIGSSATIGEVAFQVTALAAL